MRPPWLTRLSRSPDCGGGIRVARTRVRAEFDATEWAVWQFVVVFTRLFSASDAHHSSMLKPKPTGPQRSQYIMFDHVKTVLGEALQIEDRASEMTGGTPLLGNLPELDSMAVVTVLTALEDNFGFIIDDDDLVSDAFLTLDSLVSFVEDKTRQCA